MTDKPTAITTKEANEWLRSFNLGVSCQVAKQKQRVLKINLTMSQRDLVCAIIKVADRNLVEQMEKPITFKIQEGFYMMLYHYDCPEEAIQIASFRICIIPLLLKRRQALIERDTKKPAELGIIHDSQSTISSILVTPPCKLEIIIMQLLLILPILILIYEYF
jgi:hypothetical protein